MTIDPNNIEFQMALHIVENTSDSLFLTGKAGTGKSTFLNYICSKLTKKFVVLAPTGIAALNVNGMTIHSFFGLPLRPIMSNDSGIPFFNQDDNKHKRKIIEEVELVIVDEVSMVRADVFEGLEQALRKNSKAGDKARPFGGKQLLLIGDLFQLEPVISKEERELFNKRFQHPYFFASPLLAQLRPHLIELKKVYRQTDLNFIRLLDKVRRKQILPVDLDLLNKRYAPNFQPALNDFIISLCSTNRIASRINDKRLGQLSSSPFTYQGKFEGDYPETQSNLPAPLFLTLKVDAQVVFVRNDYEKRWVNGSIGKVVKLEPEEIWVQLDNGMTVEVVPTEWEKKEYEWDDKEGKITTKILGIYRQYPLKLAWGITIHKSQGLTFDKVIIDLGRGAFAAGQTYVALSRCRSFEGIYLRNKVNLGDIQVSLEVLQFSKLFKGAEERLNELREIVIQKLEEA